MSRYPCTVVRATPASCDAGDVDDLPVERRRHREEAHEPRQVAHQGFGADLLPQIELRVGFEHVTRRVARPDERNRSVAPHTVEIEVRPELRGGQREHHPPERAARQQVRAGRLELARARAEQGEAQAQRRNAPVDLVQQRRQPLHLIDDHPRAWRPIRHHLVEESRIREQVEVQPLVEEVQVERVGQRRPGPRALAGASHAEEEEALGRRVEQARVARSRNGRHVVINP